MLRWQIPYGLFPVDLFLVASVTIALRRSAMTSQLFGLFAGLAEDAFTGGVIGIHALSKMTISLVVSGLKNAVMIQGLFQRCLTFALATLANTLIIAGINGIFHRPFITDWYTLVYKVIINTILGMIMMLYFRSRDRKKIAARTYEKP